MDSEDSYAGQYQLKGTLEELIKTWNYTQLLPKDTKYVVDSNNSNLSLTKDQINLEYIKNWELSTLKSESELVDFNSELNSNVDTINKNIDELQKNNQEKIDELQKNSESKIEELNNKFLSDLEIIKTEMNIKTEHTLKELDAFKEQISEVYQRLEGLTVLLSKISDKLIEFPELKVDNTQLKVDNNELKVEDTNNINNPVIQSDSIAIINIIDNINNISEISQLSEIKADLQQTEVSPIEKFFEDNNSLSYSDKILNTIAPDSESKSNNVRENFVNIQSKTELEEEIEKVEVEDSDAERYDLFLKKSNELSSNSSNNNSEE